jgi:hypothetical protein
MVAARPPRPAVGQSAEDDEEDDELDVELVDGLDVLVEGVEDDEVLESVDADADEDAEAEEPESERLSVR